MRKFLLTAFAALLLCSPAFADVYIWKDQSGKEIYTSDPPPEGTPYMRIPEGEIEVRRSRTPPVEPLTEPVFDEPAPVQREVVKEVVPVIVIQEKEYVPVPVKEETKVETWNTISTVNSLRKKKRPPEPPPPIPPPHKTTRSKSSSGNNPPYVPGQGGVFVPGR